MCIAQRQPHHPVRQGRLHQCRRRALRGDRGDIILTPNGTWHDHGNEGERAGDLDRHAGLAADGVSRLRLGRPGMPGGPAATAKASHRPHRRLFSPALRPRRHRPTFVNHQRGWGRDPAPMIHYRGADSPRHAAQPAQGGRCPRGHPDRSRQPGHRQAGVQDLGLLRRSSCAPARRPSPSARPAAPSYVVIEGTGAIRDRRQALRLGDRTTSSWCRTSSGAATSTPARATPVYTVSDSALLRTSASIARRARTRTARSPNCTERARQLDCILAFARRRYRNLRHYGRSTCSGRFASCLI